MAMLDLDYPIKAGTGVAAAQEWYRSPVNLSANHEMTDANQLSEVAGQ